MAKNYTAFNRVAIGCTPDELVQMLKNNHDDDRVIDEIRKGVKTAFNREDSGSYCENASSGYGNALEKTNIMDRFDTRLGEFSNIPQ